MIWDPYHECMDIEQRRELQRRRLSDTIAHLKAHVPFYRDRLDIEPWEIESIDVLGELPLTTKEDILDNYPFGLFAERPDEVVRVHASSGTTGKPKVVGYTDHDVNVFSEVVARAIACAGGTPQDVLHVSYGYGLFTGGLGLHYGGECLGCTVIPMSAGNTERQLLMMQDIGSTIIACTPSYALTLADQLEERGISPDDLALKSGILGAEPWSEGTRQAIEEKLRISAHDIYGLSEIIGPGVANECQFKGSMHIFDDHFVPEIIDPETGELVPDGEPGELVVTTITKECFPLIRYRTGDISMIDRSVCECGRTHPRIGRIVGRTDDMLIIRGVNVFPSQIEHALLNIEEAEPHYQLVIRREGRLDVLEVQVEVSGEIFSDTVRRLEQVEEKIAHAIRSSVGIRVDVKLVEPKTIERSIGKATRVIDQREEV